MSQVKDRLMTVDDVAARLLVSPKTVRRLVGAAQFRCAKVGGSLRVWSSSVEDYLARQTEQYALDNGLPDHFEGQ